MESWTTERLATWKRGGTRSISRAPFLLLGRDGIDELKELWNSGSRGEGGREEARSRNASFGFVLLVVLLAGGPRLTRRNPYDMPEYAAISLCPLRAVYSPVEVSIPPSRPFHSSPLPPSSHAHGA